MQMAGDGERWPPSANCQSIKPTTAERPPLRSALALSFELVIKSEGRIERGLPRLRGEVMGEG